jgi:Kef-type K+ transport system membrane component KefB/nucleotide-binding universal stress UspA family protein
VSQIPALPGHALSVLLIQMALILGVSRLLAELMKRIGQPAVIGELLTGIVLGPSAIGWLWPGYLHAIFPAEATQVHLLEVVAWIGMVLLLLLTGFETDVRLLRNLGRAAMTSSVFGMVIPFVSGLVLGMTLPSEFLTNPDQRILFSAFLATAMSISAMPVIAKILLDMELTKRNISLIILSAGVVDDTTGWLLLSLIAGIAKAQDNVMWQFGKTVAYTAAFLAGCRYLVYPFARRAFRFLDDHGRSANADMVLVVIITFVLASITEAIHIHAVFGAFVAGCILRQVPNLKHSTMHRLESVAMAVFAPIFFGLAGLKVELRSLSSPKLALTVLGVATAGKMIGCTIGGLVGKLKFWESFAIGIAMNARGAMELVVAMIGLTLGILSPAMYASIVVMAIATSFIAPIGLRLVLHLVKMTPEEEARINATGKRGLFEPARIKVLLPTAGGPNALTAGRIGASLVRGESPTMLVMFVQSTGASIWRSITSIFRTDPAGQNLQEHLDLIKGYAKEKQARVEVRKQTDPDPVGVICREAAHGYDLILIGAGLKNPLRSGVTNQLLDRAPCHVAIVRGRTRVADRGSGFDPSLADPRRILVATNGSYFSIAAVEIAILYAERVGASVTVLYAMDPDPEATENPDDTQPVLLKGFRRMMATTLLTTLSPLVAKTSAKVNVIVSEDELPTPPVLAECRTGMYQLLVVGAENRQVQHRLSVGYDLDKLMNDAGCAVMVIVPKIAPSTEGSLH